jgi:hypothetical protein
MSDETSVTTLVSVSEALRRKLVDGGILSEDKIRFNSPDNRPELAEPYLLVYLYCVSEDPSLRNYEEPSPYVSTEGRVSEYAEVDYPPTVLDLHYLFIPYGADPAFEMMMIGGIKRIFRNQPIIQPEYLPLPMRATQLRAVSNNPDMDYIYQLWSLFSSTSYKLSVIYTVTPVVVHSGEDTKVVRTTQVDEVYYRAKTEDAS